MKQAALIVNCDQGLRQRRAGTTERECARSGHRKIMRRPVSKLKLATLVALGGFLTTLATQSWHWTPEFAGAVITIATQRVVAYVVKNDDALGGVPGKTAS